MSSIGYSKIGNSRLPTSMWLVGWQAALLSICLPHALKASALNAQIIRLAKATKSYVSEFLWSMVIHAFEFLFSYYVISGYPSMHSCEKTGAGTR